MRTDLEKYVGHVIKVATFDERGRISMGPRVLFFFDGDK
jgi:hypothetical protein